MLRVSSPGCSVPERFLRGLRVVAIGRSLVGRGAVYRTLSRGHAVALSLCRVGTVPVREERSGCALPSGVGMLVRPWRAESRIPRSTGSLGALRIARYSVLGAVGAGVVGHVVDILACPSVDDHLDDAGR